MSKKNASKTAASTVIAAEVINLSNEQQVFSDERGSSLDETAALEVEATFTEIDENSVALTIEVDAPLPVIDGLIDGAPSTPARATERPPFVTPTKAEHEDDLGYAMRVAAAVREYNKGDKKSSSTERAKPSGKLNAEEAVKVLARLAAGEKQSSIAKDYGCHPSTISDIKAGRLYGKATGVELKVKEVVSATPPTPPTEPTDEQVAANSADVQSFE